MTISPQALLQTIKVNCLRRPLWSIETVSDFLDISRGEVMKKIEDGSLPVAFDIGRGAKRREPRILALSAVELQTGPIQGIGATRNLKLPEAINLILPGRDVRSTELKHLFQVGNDWCRRARENFVAIRRPDVADGPQAYWTFSRQSVAAWLETRRIS
jgi:hypothetical protein